MILQTTSLKTQELLLRQLRRVVCYKGTIDAGQKPVGNRWQHVSAEMQDALGFSLATVQLGAKCPWFPFLAIPFILVQCSSIFMMSMRTILTLSLRCTHIIL